MSAEWEQQPDDLLSPARLRRRPRRKRTGFVHPMKRIRLGIAMGFGIILLIGFIIYQQIQSERFAIVMNGRTLAVLASRRDAEAAVISARRQYAPELPQVVQFKDSELTIVTVKHPPRIMAREEAQRIIAKLTPISLKGYGIFVKGVPIVMLATKAQAIEALAIAQRSAVPSDRGVPTFRERVVVAPYTQSFEEEKRIPALPPKLAARELTHPPRPQYAVVERGDSFYTVATGHNLPLQTVRKLNPTLKPSALQPGDKIRLPDSTAPLTVVIR